MVDVIAVQLKDKEQSLLQEISSRAALNPSEALAKLLEIFGPVVIDKFDKQVETAIKVEQAAENFHKLPRLKLDSLPDLCSIPKAVTLGVFRSDHHARTLIRQNKPPVSTKIGVRNIVFKKNDLADWLRSEGRLEESDDQKS